ncbi:MAG: hypothetical protein V1645_03775 [archaeon]
MKKLLVAFIVLLVVFVSGCSKTIDSEPGGCDMEAKICPDGSSVGRSGPNCEFAPCPPNYLGDVNPSDLVYCDANTRCPDGMECYKFQDDDKAYCYNKGNDPCIRCDDPSRCVILESYPAQIKCD